MQVEERSFSIQFDISEDKLFKKSIEWSTV